MSWLTETLNKIAKSYEGLNTSAMQGAGSMGLLNIERASEKMNPEEAKEFKLKAKANLVTGTMLAPAAPFLVNGLVTAPVTTALELAGGTAAGIGATLATDKAIEYGSDGKYTGFTDYITKKFPDSNPYIIELFHPAAWVGGAFGAKGIKPAASYAYRAGKYAFNTKLKGVAGTPKSHLLGDDAVKMFKEYSKDYVLPTTETENIRQLRAYIPEVRERYGLVGNNKVSDDDILKALYKQVSELDGGTAARNIDGEPQLLFRGDTKRYTELKPRVSPEELVTMSGTMDNSLGTLFLGELPGTGVKGQGLERYLVYGREFNGNKQLIGSGTGAHVVSPSGGRISEFDAVASFPQGSRHLVTHTTSRGIPHSYYKLPPTYSSTGVNDINGFVVRTPNMRNASREISVLNDDFLVLASPDKVSYYGPKRTVLLDKDGFPLLLDENGNVVGNALAGSSERSAMAQHYRHVLDDAKLHNQGLLKSEGGGTNGIPGNYLRDEHTHFNYFALPNFNIRNAKHILPYDFRVPRNWNDPNIYKVALPLIGIGGVGLTLGNNTESYKQGGHIHIKEKNKGKFTESAKRAGKSVQKHAKDVVKDPKATKLQKKRALFALNAKKFKH